MLSLVLVLALIVEAVLGDPSNPYHPVAWFGRWLVWVESFLYRDSVLSGCLAYVLVIALPWFLVFGLYQFLCFYAPILGLCFAVLCLWLSIGWKSLLQHVRAVSLAVDLPSARRAVACIVGRDRQTMQVDEVAKAALESLAENASDAVAAPLFWFVLFGPMGAVFYRMVNTLDAMWAYKNERYLAFGRCAARVDDVLNLIPARVYALLLLCYAGACKQFCLMREQAKKHQSPNAGWPESALAYALGIRLGGEVQRHGRLEHRAAMGASDAEQPSMALLDRALRLVHGSLCLFGLFALLATLAKESL